MFIYYFYLIIFVFTGSTYQADDFGKRKSLYLISDDESRAFMDSSKKDDYPCEKYAFSGYHIVCKCNSTYCDTIGPIVKPTNGKFVMYSSDRGGTRFFKTQGKFTASKRMKGISFKINKLKKEQKIFGFGGAFTDSAGFTILSLSKRSQENLLKSYFSPEGIEYNFGRVPIGGCDFSVRPYSLVDTPGDVDLNTFSLSNEDFLYKIPIIKEAQNMSRRTINLIGTSWSAPGWMKTSNDFIGFGLLRDEYYQSWALYHLKFLESYKKEGLDFWGITTANEPSNGFVAELFNFNSMGWYPEQQAEWIAQNFGPTLRKSELNKTKIIGFDDQRYHIPGYVESYKNEGLDFWGITTANEPSNGFVAELCDFNSMGWYPEQQAEWIAQNFGPTLRNSELNKTKIIGFDDQRYHIPGYVGKIMSNKEAARFIDGFGIHWYGDSYAPPEIVSQLREKYPNKFLLNTEASQGFDSPGGRVIPGSWERGERYAEDIIQDLHLGMSGWIEWNLSLDMKGGPNWAGGAVDPPILIDADKDEFYKQPTFYAIGHFSKFIKPGAKKIGISPRNHSHINALACINDDKTIVVVLQNRGPEGVAVNIIDERTKRVANIFLEKNSLNTIIY